jgi:hypothetical protein
MLRTGQIIAIIAIAVGAGLYAFSRHLDPPLNASTPGSFVSANSSNHEVAAAACGWGIAFITLGVLLLAVPWINQFVALQSVKQPSSGTG